MDGMELLGHQLGYIWAIYYAQGKARSHFALIHADGAPLAETVAKEIIKADKQCKGVLHSLVYLAPPVTSPNRAASETSVIDRYKNWLEAECGYIQLDGLPADTDLSAVRLRLERLFVPLNVSELQKQDEAIDPRTAQNNKTFPIGSVLEKTPHLALLAVPGGGKSTLLKRLAMAYAFPERRAGISDNLPNKEWLPLLLRCRELRGRAQRPILELINDIPLHAGMTPEECAVFQSVVHRELRTGKVLLLIDGLDEISVEGDRQTFANHLRTLLAIFPKISLVVTSREAGFRLVAGVIASVCEQMKLAPLDKKEVLDLCERWHIEVISDTEKVRTEAKVLGQEIWDNQYIRKLVENPLLLTTLLVVRRTIRELPRSRAALYREAIRVLVRTWNVEGYEPLDEDEALAQLSYVACAMMAEGKQRIGQKALLKLLQNARRELEAELQFARISSQEFISRIEYRSSLLMQTGHERIDDELQTVYEFRHLTFQEYLAARGYVEEQYPGRDEGKALDDILSGHFSDESWREVIPLAAVLAGRKAEALVKHLISACDDSEPENSLFPERDEWSPIDLLYRCIRDEVQVTSSTLNTALKKLASVDVAPRRTRLLRDENWVTTIYEGKFGKIFQEIVEQEYLSGRDGFEKYLYAQEKLAEYSYVGKNSPRLSDALIETLRLDLEGNDRPQKIRAALFCMILAFYNNRHENAENWKRTQDLFQNTFPCICAMLIQDDMPSAVAACWALAWVGQHRLLSSPPPPELIKTLYHLLLHIGEKSYARYAAWALSAQPLLPRNTFNVETWGDCDSFLRNMAAVDTKNDFEIIYKNCALVIGWYRRSPWSDDELASMIKQREEFRRDVIAIDLLNNLGDAGMRVIKEWENEEGEKKGK